MKQDGNPIHLARLYDFARETIDVLFPVPSPTVRLGRLANLDGFKVVSGFLVDNPQLVETRMTRSGSPQRTSESRSHDGRKAGLSLKCFNGFGQRKVVKIAEPVEELTYTMEVVVKLHGVIFARRQILRKGNQTIPNVAKFGLFEVANQDRDARRGRNHFSWRNDAQRAKRSANGTLICLTQGLPNSAAIGRCCHV